MKWLSSAALPDYDWAWSSLVSFEGKLFGLKSGTSGEGFMFDPSTGELTSFTLSRPDGDLTNLQLAVGSGCLIAWSVTSYVRFSLTDDGIEQESWRGFSGQIYGNYVSFYRRMGGTDQLVGEAAPTISYTRDGTVYLFGFGAGAVSARINPDGSANGWNLLIDRDPERMAYSFAMTAAVPQAAMSNGRVIIPAIGFASHVMTNHLCEIVITLDNMGAQVTWTPYEASSWQAISSPLVEDGITTTLISTSSGWVELSSDGIFREVDGFGSQYYRPSVTPSRPWVMDLSFDSPCVRLDGRSYRFGGNPPWGIQSFADVDDFLIVVGAGAIHVFGEPPHLGRIDVRQRQNMAGNTTSWPLRQRQNGGETGSWPLRQRQT